MRDFQSQKAARNTILGFETTRMFQKGQCRSMVDSRAGGSEVRFIGRLLQVFVA